MNRIRVIIISSIIFFLSHISIKSGTAETGPGEPGLEPLPVGNFSLPTSQQPGPLVGFGQNIVDKNDLLLIVTSDQYKGKNRNIIESIPGILYGISDECSLYCTIPFYIKNKVDSFSSSGIQDIMAQVEYAYYTKKNQSYTFQSTIVGNITFPTGSHKKQPPTGLGSPSIFLGATFNYQALYWNIITAAGITLPTHLHGIQFGKGFLYQCELEGIIANPPGWIFAWMLEFDGFYSQKNNDNPITRPHQGSNTIFFTPSIWISSEHLIFQIGVGVPIHQSAINQQSKFTYSIVSNVEWKF